MLVMKHVALALALIWLPSAARAADADGMTCSSDPEILNTYTSKKARMGKPQSLTDADIHFQLSSDRECTKDRCLLFMKDVVGKKPLLEVNIRDNKPTYCVSSLITRPSGYYGTSNDDCEGSYIEFRAKITIVKDLPVTRSIKRPNIDHYVEFTWTNRLAQKGKKAKHCITYGTGDVPDVMDVTGDLGTVRGASIYTHSVDSLEHYSAVGSALRVHQ